jgi:hypothetical protein
MPRGMRLEHTILHRTDTPHDGPNTILAMELLKIFLVLGYIVSSIRRTGVRAVGPLAVLRFVRAQAFRFRRPGAYARASRSNVRSAEEVERRVAVVFGSRKWLVWVSQVKSG